ncbi:hypothetical protein [Thermococcus celer]|uniref:Uncharacterized protein n=1 Tax=Thermococcus celer Vu 13 = JCM 8558 TaxID=1293037 RepID=A0A218P0H3_THECE|nr:hypothetical protein [Thermococcus celer]ASI98437.1 hypothetical protein A3L02_02075 [Thermococcus celer Vu 13 = JCM 8558]
MKLPRILIPFFAFVWELIPLFKIPVEYYIKGGMVWFKNWTGSTGRPYVCWREYSPSPIFVLLVLLPALVLLASYIFHRDSSLRNLGFSMLFSLLAATIAPVFISDFLINFILLMLVSLSSGTALGKDMGDRAILAFGGFLPGLVVILVIFAQFHGAC